MTYAEVLDHEGDDPFTLILQSMLGWSVANYTSGPREVIAVSGFPQRQLLMA
jgi:hypothetical protein